jgi:hypothetical protein
MKLWKLEVAMLSINPGLCCSSNAWSRLLGIFCVFLRMNGPSPWDLPYSCLTLKHEVGYLAYLELFCGWMDHHHGTLLLSNTQV